MAKNPAFQFYANDFLADTAEWTNEEVGAYIRLLSLQWINGSITADINRLPYGAEKVWDNIGFKFVKSENGRLINTKLEKIRQQKIQFIEKQRANGAKGGRPKNPNITQKKPKQNLLEDEVEVDNESENGIEYSNEVKNCFKQCLTYFPEQLYPKKPNTWLETIDKLQRIDKVPFDKIVEITSLTRKNDFWSKNFLSLTKLRKKNGDDIPYIVVFNEQLKKNGQINQSEVEYWLDYYSSGSNA